MPFLRALLVPMFAAVSFGASAASPDKIYSIDVTQYGTPQVGVTIKNETPNGNSTINSFIIKPPAGVTITVGSPPASPQATVANGVSSQGQNPAYIYVNAFTGLKAAGRSPNKITVNVIANYGAAAACGANFAWTAQVFTGNAFGQEEFSPVVGTHPPTNASQSAGTCSYKAELSPVSAQAGTSRTDIAATITNLNPTSGAAIGKATLAAPPGLKITGVTAPAGTTVSFTATSINVSATSIAGGGSLELKISGDVACVASTGSWGTTAATPSNGAFTLAAASSSLGFAVTGACTLSFATQPPNAVVGEFMAPAPVVVAKGAGGALVPWFGGSVDLRLGNTCSASLLGTVAAVGGSATFASVSIATAGNYTLTACSTLGSTSTFASTSSAFTVFAGGPLKCEPHEPFMFTGTPPNGVTSITQPGYAQGQRGAFNKDGPDCQPIGYTFTNNILASNSVTLRWDTALQPGAAFQYTVTWRPEYVDASTGMPPVTRKTNVAWLFDANGNPIGAVPGRACLSRDLPFKYGTLLAPITSVSATTISVAVDVTPTKSIAATPFPIMIGNERMTVTNATTSNWIVVRGVGGTPASAHASAAYVMSTPLPLDGSGTLMRMCIAEEGWTAYPAGQNNCPTAATPSPAVPVPSAPRACVLYSTTIFDIGDGFVNRDY